MTTKEFMSIVREYEKPFIQALIKKGRVKLKPGKHEMSISNVEAVDNPVLINFVDQYRDLWPKGHKGDFNACKDHIKGFIRDGHKPSKIIEVAQYWLRNHEAPYCGRAHYFLWKDKASRYLSTLEQMEEKDGQYRGDSIH